MTNPPARPGGKLKGAKLKSGKLKGSEQKPTTQDNSSTGNKGSMGAILKFTVYSHDHSEVRKNLPKQQASAPCTGTSGDECKLSCKPFLPPTGTGTQTCTAAGMYAPQAACVFSQSAFVAALKAAKSGDKLSLICTAA